MKNKFKIKEKVTEIYIQSPKYGHFTVLIDSEDLNLVFNYSWCVAKQKNFYCISTKKPLIRLHRLIMSFPKNKVIDHKNHQTLDNRKKNLRICTKQQNNSNSRKQINNTSGFKGVYLQIIKRGNKIYKYWRSQIRHNNKTIYLGYFTDTEEGKIAAAKR